MRLSSRGAKLVIPTRIVTYSREQFDCWKNGEREDCIDPYCRKLPGTTGFGEYIAGKYFESFGYEWIHHDFNFLGGNRLGKYPKAESIIRKYLGDERYEKGRGFHSGFRAVKVEEPDLLICKPDGSEIRFAECKRRDTRDKLRESQVRGMALLNLLYGCNVEVIEIVEECKNITSSWRCFLILKKNHSFGVGGQEHTFIESRAVAAF